MSSKIEWTDETWNPIIGCSKVSPGCAHCYAETMARRLKAMGRPEYQDAVNGDGRWSGKVTVVQERLTQPLRWRKPRMVFVNSMSDLFHEDVHLSQQVNIWRTMADSPQHTFQILTKRPKRMAGALQPLHQTFGILPNVWLGVSVEDQRAADERIPWLLQTPAAVRFVSAEPLLEEVQLWRGLDQPQGSCQTLVDVIDWLIIGGESGPKARPMHPDWVRSLRDQVTYYDIPFFFKQWGEWKEIQFDKREEMRGDILVSPSRGKIDRLGDPFNDNPLVGGQDFQRTVAMRRVGKKKAGRLLDGREWSEYPEFMPAAGGPGGAG